MDAEKTRKDRLGANVEVNVRRDASMHTELTQKIKKEWNSSSQHSGRLLQRFQGYWHYSVALSEGQAVSWRPVGGLNVFAIGELEVHPIESGCFEASYVPYLEKPRIYANLLASVRAFHRSWNYGVQGWNCEHWARLVVSDDPVSYQVRETWLADVFGTNWRRPEAKEHLAAHYPLL